MSKSKKTVVVLPDPHKKALSLLSKTDLSIREIASDCGFSYDDLCDLYVGKNQKDPIVVLFQAEMKKVEDSVKFKIKRLTAENKLIVLEEINALLRDMRRSGTRDERVLVPVLNALAKASAGIEINSQVNNNIFGSMSTQELVLEFRRLTAIARSA